MDHESESSVVSFLYILSQQLHHFAVIIICDIFKKDVCRMIFIISLVPIEDHRFLWSVIITSEISLEKPKILF